MTTRADLIIVGAGLAGSAAAWTASARGLDVVVLEAFGPGHRNGSSHGSARIFRRAYPESSQPPHNFSYIYPTPTDVART